MSGICHKTIGGPARFGSDSLWRCDRKYRIQRQTTCIFQHEWYDTCRRSPGTKLRPLAPAKHYAPPGDIVLLERSCQGDGHIGQRAHRPKLKVRATAPLFPLLYHTRLYRRYTVCCNPCFCNTCTKQHAQLAHHPQLMVDEPRTILNTGTRACMGMHTNTNTVTGLPRIAVCGKHASYDVA